MLLQNSHNVMTDTRHPSVLSIAGSDSGGASGIQADLRTFAACGVHGTSAITAITAQNLREVVAVRCISARDLHAQIRAVFDGFDVGAVKIGMLGSAANVKVVATALRAAHARNIVLDPVLVSSSGTPLLTARGIALLRGELFPLATIVTPNLPEAGALLGRPVRASQADAAARALLALGPGVVLLKGGHGRGRIVRDVLVRPDSAREFRHPRLPISARGTGCVLSSAIACGLARAESLDTAVERAQALLQNALRSAYRPGPTSLHVLRPAASHKS